MLRFHFEAVGGLEDIKKYPSLHVTAVELSTCVAMTDKWIEFKLRYVSEVNRRAAWSPQRLLIAWNAIVDD